MSSLTRLKAPALGHIVEDAIDSFCTLGKRSVLALLGIVIGSASIIAVTNIGHNAEQDAAKIFQDMGVDTLTARLNNDLGIEDSSLWLDAEKTRALKLPDVLIAAFSEVTGNVGFNQQYADAKIVGTEPHLVEIMNFKLARGRFLHNFDRDDNVVVLGHKVANSLSNRGPAIQVGDWVRISNYLFRVIGVMQSAKNSMLNPLFVDDSVFMPFYGLARVNSRASINDVIMRVTAAQTVEQVAPLAFEYLSRNFKTRRVEMIIPQQMIEAMARDIALMRPMTPMLKSQALRLCDWPTARVERLRRAIQEVVIADNRILQSELDMIADLERLVSESPHERRAEVNIGYDVAEAHMKLRRGLH